MIKYPGLECILLVDDDPPTNFINEKIIESSNIDTHVQSCESAEFALTYLDMTNEPQPGIIFLDINMPGMNGWDFLDHFDKMPEHRKSNTVIAMLTTSINPDDRKKAESKESVSKFLTKPLRKDQLNELITENFSIQ